MLTFKPFPAIKSFKKPRSNGHTRLYIYANWKKIRKHHKSYLVTVKSKIRILFFDSPGIINQRFYKQWIWNHLLIHLLLVQFQSYSSHCPHGLNAAFANFAMMIKSSVSPRDIATLRSKLLLHEQRLSRQAKRVTDPVVAMHSSFVNHPPFLLILKNPR
ncbi:unnamed protein product [Lactuca saligna]|uniref:Uncharacterized protein n=1 Tax=Lactuca saligna TaxID=75948 RepID=A0AA35ZRN6_LACSI|nr:unnamed protein product [Lactuca saligna]